MQSAITRPPRTIMEVYKTLPEGTHAELIEGIIYMSPSPIEKHQRIISLLAAQMVVYTEQEDLGHVYVAPFDVYLDEHLNAVQPDILFIAKENLSIIKKHVHGVPDLIIEILSAGNTTHDTIRKKDLYEKFGVREYWIVDPENKEAIGYTYVNGKFRFMNPSVAEINSELLNQRFKF